MNGTVLVVEDDADIRSVLVELLQDHGCKVRSAANGSAAMDLLKDGLRPDLILLDVMMPVMDGREFRRHQLTESALAAIPTIIFTAHPDAESVARELEATAGLRKPLDVEELLGQIGRHLH